MSKEEDKKVKLEIDLPGLYMICGLQGGGKSHLIRYIMHQSRDKFDVGIVFSNTGFKDGNFDYVDEKFVHAEYSEQVLNNFKKVFERQIKAGKPLRGFVVFDDCIEGKQWKSKALRSLCTQVRHYNITVILSTQHVKGIDVLFRGNTWKAFLFYMSSKESIEALHHAYGQVFNSFSDFKDFYTAATSPKHNMLIYDARSGGTTIESRYSIAVCPAKIPKFHVGPKSEDR